MRLQTYIQEEYKTRAKIRGESFEIFGPTLTNKDLDAACSDDAVRFIADAENKSLWVWDAYTAIHGDVWDKFSFINKGRKSYTDITAHNKLIWGIANKKGNKWIMILSDELSGMDGEQIRLETPQAGDTYDEQNYGTISFEEIMKNFKWLKVIDVNTWLRSRGHM